MINKLRKDANKRQIMAKYNIEYIFKKNHLHSFINFVCVSFSFFFCRRGGVSITNGTHAHFIGGLGDSTVALTTQTVYNIGKFHNDLNRCLFSFRVLTFFVGFSDSMASFTWLIVRHKDNLFLFYIF